MKIGLLKASALLGVLVSAASAHAWVINLGGTYTGGANPNVISLVWENDNLFPGGFANGCSFGYNFTNNAGHNLFTDGVRTLEFDFSGTNIHAGGTQVWSGTWAATNIVGLNTTSTGTYSFIFDGVGNWSESVVGQATPEPATLGLFGVGIAGLIRKRKNRK